PRRILADAQQRDTGLLELAGECGEGLVLDPAAGRIVLRIEEQQQLAAAKLRWLYATAVGRFERDIGHHVAGIGASGHGRSSSFSPNVSAQACAIPWRASSTPRKSSAKSLAPHAWART